jgi:general secretion pathway protein G
MVNLLNRNQGSGGFTLLELIIVFGIISLLSLIGMQVYGHFIDKAKNTRAMAEIRLLEKEITGFWNDYDRPPNTLAELNRPNMLDPWGKPYQYVNFDTTSDADKKRRRTGGGGKVKGKGKAKGKGAPLNSDYDLFSMGKDKTSAPSIADSTSKDDVIRADDGNYIGLASEY